MSGKSINKFVLVGIVAIAATANVQAAGGGGARVEARGGQPAGALRPAAVEATSAESVPAPATPPTSPEATADETASAGTAGKKTVANTKNMKDKAPPPPKTIYLSIGGGVDVPTANSSMSSRSATGFFAPTPAGDGSFNLPTVQWMNKYSTGYDAFFAIGNLFTTNTRIEAEFLYQNIKRKVTGTYSFNELLVNSGDSFASSTSNLINQTTTRAKVYSLMANGYYDFHNRSKWTPSLGAGIGVAMMRSPKTTYNGTLNVTDTTTGTTTAVPIVASSPMLRGGAFAYQLKAGLAYEVTPRASVALQYRFFGTSEFQAYSSGVTINSATFTVDDQNTSRLRNNTVDISFRYLVW